MYPRERSEYRMDPYETTDDFRTRRREESHNFFGSNPQDRASDVEPHVSLGGGLSSPEQWGGAFPIYSGAGLTQNGVYDPTNDPAHQAYRRIPKEVLGAELGNRTMGVPSSRTDYRGMQSVRGFDGNWTENVYDPSQDRITPRVGDTIHGQYGTASVAHVPEPADWQQNIVKQYPQIRIAGSPENKAFVEAFNQHKDWRRAAGDAARITGQIAQQKKQNFAGLEKAVAATPQPSASVDSLNPYE